MPIRRRNFLLATAVMLAGVLPSLVAFWVWLAHEQPYVDPTLHAMLEIAGGCMALGVAVLLHLRIRHAATGRHFVWVVAALVSMGILDTVHGALAFGLAWSWTRHFATFAGGTLFALVWTNEGAKSPRRTTRIVTAAAIGSTALTVFVCGYPDVLPVPWTPAGYTLWPKVLNAAGGGGFLAAAMFFLWRFHARGDTDDVVFASHTLLFAVSGLLFPISQVWGPEWWLWHAFRLIAYMVVVVHGYGTIKAMHEQLVAQNVTLETRVRQRTTALETAEERLRMAVDSAQMGVFEFLPATDVVVCDAQVRRTLGFSGAGTVTAADVFERIHADDRARVAQALANAVAPGSDGAFRAEYRIAWPDGSLHWAAANGRVYFEGTGPLRRPVMMIGILVDITVQRQAEDDRERLLAREQLLRTQAEAANRVKDELLATVSHELRTPLNAMIGWAEILRRAHDLPPERIRHALDVIHENGRRQTALINDLLDLSRIAAGKSELSLSRVRISELVESAVEMIRPAAVAKLVNLDLRVGPTADVVLGDADRLQQILGNLLSNAVKFTPEDGRVTVEERRAGDTIEIAVSDTGIGIMSEFLPYVFDPFRQADSTPTRRHGGLGLGLAITRRLVEMHGGTIAAESAGEGRGATFTVRLPALPAQPQAVEAYDLQGGRPADRRRPRLDGVRVLLVDDEPDSLDLVTVELRELGAEVHPASSASAAWHLLDRTSPDVIVADIGMPGEDGYTFIQRVRRRADPKRDIPAAAVTAYVAEHDQLLARQAGFQRHVGKPVDLGELARAVAELAGNGRSPARFDRAM